MGPSALTERATAEMGKLGFVLAEPQENWLEALGMEEAELPGVCLRGARDRENLTQRQLAAQLEIPQRHVSEMENHKRPIGKKMAQRLAEVLKVDYRVFL